MRVSTFAAITLFAAPALAEGDVAAGEKNFRKCMACHVVADADGNILAGKNGRTGPNLFGLIGRQAGSLEGFSFQPALIAAGDAGLIWTEETLAAYLLDPTGYLREYLGDPAARSAMSFKFRKENEAQDMAAYLATFSAE